jgi:hypothetical protein
VSPDRSIEKRDPDHLMTITVPLDMGGNSAAAAWDVQDALAQAMRAIMPMIRLGTLELLCGEVVVQIDECGGASGPTEPPTREELFNDG